MKRPFFIASIFAVFLLISACCNCREEFEPYQQGGIYCNGFDSSEDSSLLIKRYTKGSNYTTFLDSFEISYPNTYYNYDTSGIGDTSAFFYYPIDQEVFDYEIKVQPIGTIYRISDIKFAQQHRRYQCCGRVYETDSKTYCEYLQDSISAISKGATVTIQK